MHATLCCTGNGLLDGTIIHLLCLNEQCVVSTIDEIGKVSTRVNRAYNQVGIIEAGRGVVPVCVEDGDNRLHILCIGVNDVVFAVVQAVAVATEGRAGEVGGHDVGCFGIDDHTLFVGQCEVGAGRLGLDAGSVQLVYGACGGATTAKWMWL